MVKIQVDSNEKAIMLGGKALEASEGVTPTGTISITENGTYNVTNYASADVYVPSSGGIGIPREVSANGVYQIPTESFTFSLPSNAEDIGDYGLYYGFFNSIGVTSVDLSNIRSISNLCALYRTFYNCTNLTSVDLSSLTTVSGSSAMSYAFHNCTNLAGSINLSSLATVSGNNGVYGIFKNCPNLTSVDLSSLTTVSGNYAMQIAFRDCTNLTSVNLSNLTTVSGTASMTNMFYNTKLTSLSFPSLTSNSFGSNTNQFNGMLGEVTGCTVHFPSNLQSVIGSWSSVTSGFSGINTTVLFDLPATT